MGTGSGSVSRACPASSKCATHDANNSSVCVNGFTPLQLSVEYENAAVERDQGAAAPLHHRRVCVRTVVVSTRRSSGVHAASVSSTAAKSVSAHIGSRTRRAAWRPRAAKRTRPLSPRCNRSR